MKTFAQLKRDLELGKMVKTILNNFKPDKNGQVRKIVVKQTNAIGFEIPIAEQKANIFGEMQTVSWLWWQKASNYEYDGNQFKVFDIVNGKKTLSFIYEIL